MSAPILEKIEACWRSGLGIGATIEAVQRNLGACLSFSDVHPVFVALSWGRAS